MSANWVDIKSECQYCGGTGRRVMTVGDEPCPTCGGEGTLVTGQLKIKEVLDKLDQIIAKLGA